MCSIIRHARFAAVLLLNFTPVVLMTADASSETTAPSPLSAVIYRLGPQDKITYRVEEDPIKTGQPEALTVSALGELELPVSRGYDERIIVQANGRNLTEIKAEIKAKLENGYYKQATVHLRLVNQSRRVGQVLFYGKMVRGAIELFPNEPKMLSAAIIQLGYSDFADLKRVKLHRIDPATGTNQTTTVDVKSILKTNDRSKDILLQDGDRVEVLERNFLLWQ